MSTSRPVKRKATEEEIDDEILFYGYSNQQCYKRTPDRTTPQPKRGPGQSTGTTSSAVIGID